VQWWEGELERTYLMHKARRLYQDRATHDEAPGRAAVSVVMPAYLTQRAAEGKTMPQVHMMMRQQEEDTDRQERRVMTREAGGEEAEDEREVEAVVKYVVKELANELYTELLEGFHIHKGASLREGAS
jgi:uncharacterized protein (DUF2267 family)